MLERTSGRRTFAVIAVVLAVLASPMNGARAEPAPQQPPATPAPAGADAEAKATEQARKHFEKGVLLLDEEAWDAALAEFLRSRELRPTRSSTKNAAVCLRKLKRFDEALDMFEELLRFPNLPADDKQLAERETKSLSGLVGGIDIRGAEPGAALLIDGRERGSTPPRGALRASAGTHVVRIYKEGFQPFEARVEVAGGQTVAVQARMPALTQTGRLKVTTPSEKALDVVVDNVVVGKTPWEGTLPPGDHTVLLRGDGDIGTQPAEAPIKLNQVTALALVAEALASGVRVQPTPAGASVAIDGVTVGRGVWTGRLRSGAHRIEVASEGFLPRARDVSLEYGKVEVVQVQLERDPASPMWGNARGRFVIELDGAFALAPSFGGDVASGCSTPCSSSLPIGFEAVGRGGYRFASGFALDLDVGYLLLSQRITGRATAVLPAGLQANPGTADDVLTLQGLLLGASAGLRFDVALPVTLRLGVGALLGSLNDRRSGTFTTIALPGTPSESYSVNVAEAPSAVSVYVAPEARAGLRLGEHVELSLGIAARILFVVSQPKWDSTEKPINAKGNGQGAFAAETLTSQVLVGLTPGVGALYSF